MAKNEGPLGRFHLGLIQVFSGPLTQRTTVRRQCEKWSPPAPVQTNVWVAAENLEGGGTEMWLHLLRNPLN